MADWLLENGMPLATGCPRSPPPSLALTEGIREKHTRARVVGMLTLALAKRLTPRQPSGSRPKVAAIRDAVLATIERRGDLKGAKRATLDKYIREGLDALEGGWRL